MAKDGEVRRWEALADEAGHLVPFWNRAKGAKKR